MKHSQRTPPRVEARATVWPRPSKSVGPSAAASASASARVEVELPTRTISTVLFLAIACLAGVNVMVKVLHIAYGRDYQLGLLHEFWMDEESNVPTWFSSCLLLIASGLCALITATCRHRGETPGTRRGWAGLTVLFCLASMDEIAGLHELASSPLRALAGSGLFTATGFYWVLAGAPLCLVVVALYASFVWRLPPNVRAQVIAAGAVYVLGAVALEAFAGLVTTAHADDVRYVLIVTIEETGELVGVALFIHALLTYCREKVGPIVLCVVRSPRK